MRAYTEVNPIESQTTYDFKDNVQCLFVLFYNLGPSGSAGQS